MRRLLTFLCMCALAGPLCTTCGNVPDPMPEPPEVLKEPQEVSFYYLGDQKLQLEVRKDRIIAKAASDDEAEVLCENEIFIFAGQGWPRGEYVIASIAPEKTTIEDVRKLPVVVSATYGMMHPHGYPCYPGNQIFVKPVARTSIESIIDEVGFTEYVEDMELILTHSNVYMVTLNLNLEHILWASNELFETGLCEYAEPNLYRETQLGNE